MSKKREFSDISLSFERNPVTGDVVKVKDDVAIKQSIKTLVLSEVFEAPFQKDKGTRIRKVLFDLVSSEGAEQIKSQIRDIIVSKEPRANLYDVEIEPIPDENKYSVKIIFSIINTLDPLEVEIFVSRVR